MTKSKETGSREWKSTKGKKLKKHADSTLQSQLLWFRLPDSTQILKELSAVLHACPSRSLFLTPMLNVAFTTIGQKESLFYRNIVLYIVNFSFCQTDIAGGQMSNHLNRKINFTIKIIASKVPGSPYWSNKDYLLYASKHEAWLLFQNTAKVQKTYQMWRRLSLIFTTW